MIRRSQMGLRRLHAGVCFQVDNFRRRPAYVAILAALCLIYVIYWLTMRGGSTKVATEHYAVKSNSGSHKVLIRGLDASGSQFTLNGKPFTILSGAVHYFRVLPEYWEDRLKKLKAMGLNTVETYVAWNLHEEIKSNFKFRDELDIVAFVKLAKKLGLYVIIRPGPFICAEWELGGLPSWLLNDPKQKLRTSYGPYLEAIEKYFDELFPLLLPLEFTNGGPIIAWQIENEYLLFGEHIDKAYMERLHQIMLKLGVKEMLFTSDGINFIKHFPLKMEGVLATVNFQKNEKLILGELKKLQPDKPLMVTEFWSGWFDHWGEKHHTMSIEKVSQRVANILDMGASINLFMFHGGTNFGFMNGADVRGDFRPVTTSYDYDAPLSEAGDITPKYKALREVIRTHAPKHSIPNPFPEIPPNLHKASYDSIKLDSYTSLKKMLTFVDQALDSDTVMPMEYLQVNNNGGQGYGFIIYQTILPHNAKTLVIEEYRDRAQVLVNSKLVSTLCSFDAEKKAFDLKKMERNEVQLKFDKPADEDDKVVLDILVENLGRVNVGTAMDSQRKGILGKVLIDGNTPRKWKIYPLDFNRFFTDQAFVEVAWSQVPSEGSEDSHTPCFYRGILTIQDQPRDTFIHMKGWGKGVCFVNGHNLGRYWEVGPQEALYLPASWLKNGENTIILFELEGRRKDGILEFSDAPMLGSAVEDRP